MEVGGVKFNVTRRQRRGGEGLAVAGALAGMTGADFDKAAAAIRSGMAGKDLRCKDWVGIAVAKA